MATQFGKVLTYSPEGRETGRKIVWDLAGAGITQVGFGPPGQRMSMSEGGPATKTTMTLDLRLEDTKPKKAKLAWEIVFERSSDTSHLTDRASGKIDVPSSLNLEKIVDAPESVRLSPPGRITLATLRLPQGPATLSVTTGRRSSPAP